MPILLDGQEGVITVLLVLFGLAYLVGFALQLLWLISIVLLVQAPSRRSNRRFALICACVAAADMLLGVAFVAGPRAGFLPDFLPPFIQWGTLGLGAALAYVAARIYKNWRTERALAALVASDTLPRG